MPDPSKGRIAIKLGPSTTSKSTPSPRAPPPTTLGKRPRQTLALGDASDSDSDTDAHHGRHEEITAFGRDGAETDRKRRAAERVKKEYVIAKQPNRDWRTEMRARRRRSRNLLPEEARQQQQQNGDPAAVETQPADQDEGLRWGLTLPETETESKDDTDDEQPAAAAATAAAQEPTHLTAAADPPKPRSADDEALDALLGNKTGPERTIAAPSEDDVYKRDAAEAGAASTLDDYEAMPVEEFGAALLRGMGWDGEPTGPKVKEARRRPNRLGLGAKELKDAEDLGGWNQNGNKGRSRPRLADYRREESKKKESRGREDSYKRERERERERERGGNRDRERERERDRNKDRDRYRDERRDRDRDSHRDRRR